MSRKTSFDWVKRWLVLVRGQGWLWVVCSFKSNLTQKIGHSFSNNPICPITWYLTYIFFSKINNSKKLRIYTQLSRTIVYENMCLIIFQEDQTIYLGEWLTVYNCTTYIIYILRLHLISNSVAIYGLTRNGQQDGQRLPKNQHPLLHWIGLHVMCYLQ